jgi:hypothetical protein
MKQATRRSFRIRLLISMSTLLMGLVPTFGSTVAYAAPRFTPGGYVNVPQYCRDGGYGDSGYFDTAYRNVHCVSNSGDIIFSPDQVCQQALNNPKASFTGDSRGDSIACVSPN